ncbi:PE family protein [Nocardia sp. A7]|uniref:PE family protein n=1 Tax=Nocardia sp. A7 TaxID=2789274 RepID=UPI0039792CD0
MRFDPVEAVRVAAELDQLAGRLETDLQAHQPALPVAAPGLDEVSQQAAQTLRAVAEDFGFSAGDGVLELRRLAATLRTQARELAAMDQGNAADLGAAS